MCFLTPEICIMTLLLFWYPALCRFAQLQLLFTPFNAVCMSQSSYLVANDKCTRDWIRLVNHVEQSHSDCLWGADHRSGMHCQCLVHQLLFITEYQWCYLLSKIRKLAILLHNFIQEVSLHKTIHDYQALMIKKTFITVPSHHCSYKLWTVPGNAENACIDLGHLKIVLPILDLKSHGTALFMAVKAIIEIQ